MNKGQQRAPTHTKAKKAISLDRDAGFFSSFLLAVAHNVQTGGRDTLQSSCMVRYDVFARNGIIFNKQPREMTDIARLSGSAGR